VVGALAVRALVVGALIAVNIAPTSVATTGNQTQVPVIQLAAYEQPDGAITVFPDGLFVEPYFAMRALLTAADLGLETDTAARRWIAWQLPRLDQDSVFKRYCRAPGGAWAACGSADADDSSLALWIELLYRTAGSRPLPPEWRRSVARSEAALAALFDARTGVYVVSRALPVSLFMDNIEVLAELEAVAHAHQAAGRRSAAVTARSRATRLRRAIDKVFWNKTTGTYLVTTQGRDATPAFYPDVVAQVFPAIFGHGSPAEPPKQLVARWMASHGREWIADGEQEYPWGLLATAALRYGQRDSAICWYGAAMSLRHGVRWNVLEEAVFQALTPVLSIGGAPPPCAAAWLPSH
jgi:hypothetical protein